MLASIATKHYNFILSSGHNTATSKGQQGDDGRDIVLLLMVAHNRKHFKYLNGSKKCNRNIILLKPMNMSY